MFPHYIRILTPAAILLSRLEHRPWEKWSRSGQSISVQTVRNWGFELVLGEDGLLRGEYILDQWSGEGEHSRNKTPVGLNRKPAAP